MGTYAFVQPVISRVTGNLEFLYLQNQVSEFLSQNCGAADWVCWPPDLYSRITQLTPQRHQLPFLLSFTVSYFSIA